MFKIVFYRELCCDECNGIIHIHMDCPACEKSYAGTLSYGMELTEYAGDCTVQCEECKARFHTAGQDPYEEDTEQWEQLPSEVTP